jgi:hypothetical protein
MSVNAACRTGNHRKALDATILAVSAALDIADPRDVAPLAGRLQALLTERASMPGDEENETDDLAERRTSRRAASDAKLRPKKRRRTEQRT